jgi:hypothetical protein
MGISNIWCEHYGNDLSVTDLIDTLNLHINEKCWNETLKMSIDELKKLIDEYTSDCEIDNIKIDRKTNKLYFENKSEDNKKIKIKDAELANVLIKNNVKKIIYVGVHQAIIWFQKGYIHIGDVYYI